MMGLLRFRIKEILLLVLVVGCIGCENDASKVIENKNSGPALGTSYNIIYFSNKKVDYQKAIDSVFRVINKSLSTYIPTSDISKINKGDSILKVDEMFKDVFLLSKEINSKTNGYFDPTVGILVNAWGFGPGKQIALDSAKVDSLLHYVGFNKVQLRADKTIKKSDPNIYFDFNAIAKGYTIDRLAVMLDNKGVKNYLIEVGGEVIAKGKNLIKNKNWVVGINDPQMEAYKATVKLKNRAMASSGNYIKFRVDAITGEKFVHTLDPITGYTKNSKVLATTVITDNCAKADGYATAFMAMDMEDSKRLIEKDSTLQVYIVYLDENGAAKDFMTKGFKTLMVE